MATLFGDPERYPAGLTEVAPGVHAWLQPNGAWGESNAGLVVGEGESLLVDTLWDLRLTARMLDAMRPAGGRGADPHAGQHARRRSRAGSSSTPAAARSS